MTNMRIESQGNADWGTVLINDQKKEYFFPYHIPTGEIFNHDPDLLIRFKCLALTGLTPLVSLSRSLYWLAQSIFMELAEFYRYLDGQSPSLSHQAIIYEKASDSIRALGYGALLTTSALMGILFPHQFRQNYGRYERILNRHWDGPHRDKFYLAICFQPLYVMSKENRLVSLEDKLSRYLARIHAIREALCSCSFNQLWNELRLRKRTHS